LLLPGLRSGYTARTGIFAAIFIVFLSCTGCGNDSNPPPEQRVPAHPLWQTQVDALQKAQGVEATVLKQAEERRREIEQRASQ